jgi:hypothetical protein
MTDSYPSNSLNAITGQLAKPGHHPVCHLALTSPGEPLETPGPLLPAMPLPGAPVSVMYRSVLWAGVSGELPLTTPMGRCQLYATANNSF